MALPLDTLIGLCVVQTAGAGPYGDVWTESPFDPDLTQGYYNVDGGAWIELTPSVAGWGSGAQYTLIGGDASFIHVDSLSFELTSAAPEPATLAVLGIGAALALLRRRRA